MSGLFVFGNANYRDAIAASASVSTGMTASKLVLTGNDHLKVLDVEVELAGMLGKPMLSLDPDEVSTALLKNRWIEASQVRKVYPDTLVVNLVEREPVALWKSEGRLYLISRDGIAIDQASRPNMRCCRKWWVAALNKVAAEFLSTMALYPELSARSRAYVRVAERRWNVVLDGWAYA